MRVVVVGAGPTGLFTAMVLARRGHEVTVVDRDPGPQHDGSWSRRGVMQFHHPHAFRAQVVEALQAELPHVWQDLLVAGAEPIMVPADPSAPDADAVDGNPVPPTDLRARSARRRPAPAGARAAPRARRPGVRRPRPRQRRPRRRRHPRRGPGHRRVRQGRPARPGPPRPGAGRRLRHRLRLPSIPPPSRRRTGPHELSARPDQHLPRLPGHRVPARQRDLLHPHRPLQRRPRAGGAALPRPVRCRRPRHPRTCHLDRPDPLPAPTPRSCPAAACTTPTRANSTTPAPSPCPDWCSSATPYAPPTPLSDEVSPPHCYRPASCCASSSTTTTISPGRRWHSTVGAPTTSPPGSTTTSTGTPNWSVRWAGADVDLTRPLPSDLIVAATAADPSLLPLVAPYLGMRALPASLDAVQSRAREIYIRGWRPPIPDGPTHDELVHLIFTHTHAPLRSRPNTPISA